MNAPRLPYYPWYVADYRASRRVQRLSIVQRGIYRELIDECWVRGYIPDDVVELASICAIPVSLMQRHWPVVRALFEEMRGADGQMLTSGRLEAERTHLLSVREKQADGGRARHAKAQVTSKSPASNLSYQIRADHIKSEALVTQAAELPTPTSRPPRKAEDWRRLLENPDR